MLDVLALAVVLLTGAYLLALAIVAFAAPQRAKSFLASFASSPTAHYVELVVRLLVGAAFVVGASRMQFSHAFSIFGWVVIATTIALLVMPWRWHHRFAAWSVPIATRRMALFAVGPLSAGAFVILSVVLGAGFTA